MGKKKLYYILHKPYQVLSQFSAENDNPGLSAILSLPKDVYPVGRLDLASEGLLILTNDKSVNHRLLNPKNLHKRTYWVEVEGSPNEEALQQLRNGVQIKVGTKGYQTQKASIKLIPIPKIDERQPPVNIQKHPIRSWLEITLTEGKNRQVRKMTAKVGHPTLRLIRVSIEQLELGLLKSGEVRQISQQTILKKLNLLQ